MEIHRLFAGQVLCIIRLALYCIHPSPPPSPPNKCDTVPVVQIASTRATSTRDPTVLWCPIVDRLGRSQPTDPLQPSSRHLINAISSRREACVSSRRLNEPLEHHSVDRPTVDHGDGGQGVEWESMTPARFHVWGVCKAGFHLEFSGGESVFECVCRTG